MVYETTDIGLQVDGAIEFAVAKSASILSRLRSVRGASELITSASDSLHGLLGQFENTDSQSETAGLLASASRSAQLSASTLEELDTHKLSEHLRYAKRHMKELEFIAMMIKIEASLPSQHTEQSTAFVNDLLNIVSILDNTTAAAIERVGPVQGKIREADQALQATAQSLTQQVTEVAGERENADALQRARDTHMQALGQEAREVSRSTAEQISQLIPRLQFADAFVQRLQNTKRFIDDAGAHAGSSTAEVLAVAAQQVKALNEDTRAERHGSVAALEALLTATEHAVRLLSENDANDGLGAWLQANASAVALNRMVIEASRGEMLFAFRQIDDAQTAMAQANEIISKFVPLVRSLNCAALNGALLASRSSSGTNSVSYALAAEVQSVGLQCGRQMTDGASVLCVVSDSLSRVDRSGMEEKIRQLAGELNMAKAQQEQAQSLTFELRQARQYLSEGAGALLEACHAAHQTIEDSKKMELDLERLMSTLGSFDTTGIAAGSVQWITGFYTTEPERALHLMLFGDGGGLVAEAPELDDDLLDFLM
ncbi:hypothetical protein [Candidatus Halocynthiibacter alkanivorans]|uniref:hypothetical protein n=1 Tax=Candidatus Halocynthiibacter alkanivorans TaxID=2267619 RepID=UPI000DF2EB9F|nr:hypothetical protein [Candidatus Halocynthiibacter alkanivorans]